MLVHSGSVKGEMVLFSQLVRIVHTLSPFYAADVLFKLGMKDAEYESEWENHRIQKY